MEKDKREYCRFCGENKGHSTAKCRNLKEIKKILADQDSELERYLQMAADAKDDLKKSRAEVEELRAGLGMQGRMLSALLDLAELQRKMAK